MSRTWAVLCPVTGDTLADRFPTEREAIAWARRHRRGVVWAVTTR